ncbi:HpcH/HpaI aldolase/citrate lyase family protein [Sphingomonas bisphenolicum]
MTRELALTTLLFVPGDSERKLAKALGTAADVIIIDLEDAVAASAKDVARRTVSALLRAERQKRVAVRVNAADTSYYLDDVAAIGMLAPDIVMLPKCRGAADVRMLSDQLAVLEAAAGAQRGGTAILPLVTETADSLLQMDYRNAGQRLCALGFAGEDFAASLGIAGRSAAGMNPLLSDARRRVAIAAAAAGVAAIDTPFPNPSDENGLRCEAVEAAIMGFVGKMCIHPSQIAVVQEALRPSRASLAWATGVVDAFAAAPDEGVTVFEGKMIDRAHLRLAERYLAQRPNDGDAG